MFNIWLGAEFPAVWQDGWFWWMAKVTVLCLVAAMFAYLTQRRSAAIAHRIWIASLAGVLLLPLLACLLPSWSTGLAFLNGRALAPSSRGASLTISRTPTPTSGLAPSHSQSVVQAIPPEAQAPALPATRANTSSLPNESTGLTQGANSSMAVETLLADSTPSLAEEETQGRIGRARTSWGALALIAWLAVTAVLIARLGVALFLLWRTVERFSKASPEMRSYVESVAASLHVNANVDVRMSTPGAMPMACWLGRWVVVTPEDFCDWPAQVRWTVVAHELGHVMRRDAWSDLVAQVACRAAWPHPLLWLASRSVRRLRERACDEWVLATGRVAAPDYARHLLDVVSRCQVSTIPIGAAMGRPGDLEGRVRWLLARKPSQPNSQRVIRIATLAGCMALTAVLAAGQPAETPSSRNEPSQTAKEPARQQERPPVVRRSTEPMPVEGPAIDVAGTVVSPDGTPIKSAEVALRAIGTLYSFNRGLRHNRDVLARTQTDSGGRFTFEKVRIPPRMEQQIDGLLRGRGGAELVAWADGLGMTWTGVQGLKNSAPVKLTLAPEAEVIGVVQDERGQGITAAGIEVHGATRSTTNIDQYLNAAGDFNLNLSEIAVRATTDSAGRFRLQHLPPDFRWVVSCDRPGFAGETFLLDTGTTVDLATIRLARRNRPPLPARRSPLEMALTPQRKVVVKVFDDGGQPVVQGMMQVWDDKRFNFIHKVDERGVSALSLPLAGKFAFQFFADPLSPQLGTSVVRDIAENDVGGPVEIRLPAPRWLTGRVVDADTGHGVPGAYLSYSNRQTFDSLEPFDASTVVSGLDGSFKIPVAAGKGNLQFIYPIYGYLPQSRFAMVDRSKPFLGTAVDIANEGPLEPVTLTVARGLNVRGTVRDGEGKPAKGVLVRAQNPDRPNRKFAAVTDSDGHFEIAGLSPHVETYVSAAGAASAAHATIVAEPDHPWDKTRSIDLGFALAPACTLSGRLLKDGQPRANVKVRLLCTIGAKKDGYPLFDEVVTDADGRYSFCGMAAGDMYMFEMIDPEDLVALDRTFQMLGAHPTPTEPQNIALPDVYLVGHGQVVSGFVVDPQGNPVANIQVNASPVEGTLLMDFNGNRPSPTSITDKKGRFEIESLPEVPLELMAYPHNPKGGPIRSSAQFRPKLNQRDIRIIFDPELKEEDIEDLDSPVNGKNE